MSFGYVLDGEVEDFEEGGGVGFFFWGEVEAEGFAKLVGDDEGCGGGYVAGDDRSRNVLDEACDSE